MSRFGEVFNAKKDTFLGVAGSGDLFLTANSTMSRNYRVGLNLAKGKLLEDILKELGVSLYGGKVDNTVVPPNVQQTQTSGVQASETPQNIQSVQQTQATQVSQSAEEDDDLDFLDDL